MAFVIPKGTKLSDSKNMEKELTGFGIISVVTPRTRTSNSDANSLKIQALEEMNEGADEERVIPFGVS